MSRHGDTAADGVGAEGRGRYGDSRRGLAEAAIRYFEERGFSQTTVGEVSRAAGYSERTFFRQFSTKEDVVFFDLPDILEPVRRLDPASVTLAEAFERVGAAMIDGARGWESDAPELAERRARMIFNDAALYRRLVEISTEWEVEIALVFARSRGTAAGQDLLSQALAGAVVTGCRSSMKTWLATPGSSLAKLMEEALALITSGYGLLPGPPA